jgi:sugar (pentulose or hexulose) kinase
MRPCNPGALPALWLDAKASKQAEYLKRRIDKEQFYEITGILEITGACPVSKIL